MRISRVFWLTTILLLVPALAHAQWTGFTAPAPSAEDTGRHISKGQMVVAITAPSYYRSTVFLDENGDEVDLTGIDSFVTTSVYDLTLLWGLLIEGLELGINVPAVVNRTVLEADDPTVVDIDEAYAGVGDIAVHVGYEHKVSIVTVGARAALKLPTGLNTVNRDASVAVGSGQLDIGLLAFARTNLGPVTVDGAGGYILRQQKPSFDDDPSVTLGDSQPGNVFHGELGAAYRFGDTFAVGAAVLYYGTGTARQEGKDVTDSEASLLSIAPAVWWRPTPIIEVSAALRARRVGTGAGGTGLAGIPVSGPSIADTGYPLSGKNAFSSSIRPFSVNFRFLIKAPGT